MNSGPFIPPITKAFLEIAAEYKSAVKWGFEHGLLALRQDAGQEAHQFVQQRYVMTVRAKRATLDFSE